MSDYTRQQLAFMQEQLVRALVDGAAAPADFDRERLAAATEALWMKRARAVARAWPQLTRTMRGDFTARFAEYARVNPLPSFPSSLLNDGSPLADGRAFAGWLERAGLLTDEGRLAAFAFDARYSVRKGALIRRRGPLLRALRLRQAHRFIMIVRLPFLGERWIEFRDSLKHRRRARV